jgi:WD40 repeat protein
MSHLEAGHRAYVRGVAILDTEKGAVLVSGGYDGLLASWQLEPFSARATVRAHANGVGALVGARGSGVVVSGGADGRLCWWSCDSDSIRLESSHLVHQSGELIEAIGLDAQGGRAAAGTVDGSLFVVNRETGPRLLGNGFISINAIHFTPDGRFLFIASDHCRVHLVSTDDGTEVWRSDPFDDHVDGLAIEWLTEGRARLWAVTHGKHLWRLELDAVPPKSIETTRVAAGRSALNAVAVCEPGTVVCGGDDGTVFEATVGEAVSRPLGRVTRDIDALAVLDDGRVAVASTAGLAILERREHRIVATAQRYGALAAVTRDGNEVVAGFHDAPLIWRSSVERCLSVSSLVSCAAAGALVFGLRDGSVVILEGESVRLLGRCAAEVEGICQFHDSDESTIAAVDRDGVLTLFSETGGSRAVAVSRCGDRLKTVVHHEVDGRPMLYCAGKDRTVYEVDPRTLIVRALPWAHSALRTFNALATDGDLIFAASWDNRIHVGRRRGDVIEAIGTLDGHTHAVEALVVAGDRLVSTGYDGHVGLWDLRSMLALTRIPISELALRRACLGARPGTVWVAGYDGLITEIELNGGRIVSTWEVRP